MSDSGPGEEAEAFAESLPLTAVFGTHPKTEIIGVLLTADADPPTHFSINEIERIAGLDTESVEKHVRDLQELGIVVETDELDQAATFTLDESSDIVARIRQLAADLFEHTGPTNGS